MLGKRRRRGRTREMDARDWNWCQLEAPAGHYQWKKSRAAAAPPRPRSPSRLPSRNWPILLAAALLLAPNLAAAAAAAATTGQRAEPDGAPVILKTDQEQLFRGLRHRSTGRQPAQDVISFLGVRYASAPVRRLRFMPPTPFTYAPGQVHEARAFGPICPQRLPVAFSERQAQLLALALAPSTRAPAEARRAELRALQLELMAGLLPAGRAGQAARRLEQLLELTQAEDCLSLNLFAPLEAVRERLLEPPEVGGAWRASERRNNNGASLRPVLVVLHADSFDFGAGATISGARQFAADNNLLVVTLNFRLNLLGFPPTSAHAPTSAPAAGASGRARAARTNLGLLDQVAALHWVQANARSFGGAPQNVTLLGLKRGAALVNLLMLSPLAKGLFQRAIMEDGTALLAGNNNQHHHQQQQQQQVAWQHLRLLALMAECPAGGGATSQAAAGGVGEPVAEQQQQQQQQQRQLAAFECLRANPVELLVQPIPFGLLDAGASAALNELVLARRWLKPLAAFLNRSSSGAPIGQPLDGELAQRLLKAAAGEPQAAVQVSAGQLDQLIAHLVAAKQHQLRAPPADGGAAAATDELLDELLGAIYLPSNETLAAAPFAPQLEPWDPDERSPFGQHDLLLGSSQPLLLEPVAQSRGASGPEQAAALDEDDAVGPAPLLQPLERFGAPATRRLGLTDEQALQQVGLFVRAHFRFHQQEIANSIVSNYFLNGQLASGAEQQPVELQQRQQPQDERVGARRQAGKQLQLLRSLEGALKDALISVPLVRTALVHSLRQLEALGELFVEHQASQMLAGARESPQQANGSGDSSATSVALEFQRFARNLYEQPQLWPLELVGTTAAAAAQTANQTANYRVPRATYLYQVAGAELLRAKLQLALAKLDERAAATAAGGQQVSRTLVALGRNVREKLLKRAAGAHSAELGLGCALLLEPDAAPADGLLGDFRALVCRSLGAQVIRNFATSGNVNKPVSSAEVGSDLEPLDPVALEQFEAECGALVSDSNSGQQQQQPDHDSVQLEGGGGGDLEGVLVLEHATSARNESAPSFETSESCRAQLDALTLEYLAGALAARANAPPAWSVFNVFSQQLASFGGAGGDQTLGASWALESLATAASGRHQRDRFERKIAFWANFLPTLDCPRTQPISASSLSLAQASNATLLNMNLNSNCQQQGGASGAPAARTAAALLQAIGARAKQTLADFASSLAKQQQQQQRQQQHKALEPTARGQSLRMATNESQQQLAELAARAPANRQLNSSLGSWLTVDSQQELTPANATAPAGLLALLFAPAGAPNAAPAGQRALMSLWLLAGAILIGSTLLTSGFVLLARRRRRHKQAAAAAKQRKQSATIQAQGQEQHTNGAPVTDFDPVVPHQMVPHHMVLPNGHLHLERAEQLTAQEFTRGHHHHDDDDDDDEAYQPPGEPPRPLNNFAADYAEQQQQQQRQGDAQLDEHRQARQVLLPILAAPRNFVPAAAPPPHRHLAGCSNLLQENEHLMQQQQQQVLSSSSETTTNNTQRAHSSVSLVSSSTNTTTTIANQPLVGANQPGSLSKKRVKISDPKRRAESSSCNYQLVAEYLGQQPDDNSTGPLYLDGGDGGGLLASMDQLQLQLDDCEPAQANASHFCPIHRAGSSSYLLTTGAPTASTSFVTPTSGASHEDEGAYWQTHYFHNDEQYAQQQQHQQQQHSNGGVATVGSLAEYLNLVAAQDDLVGQGGSLRAHATLGRKRRHHQRNGAGLCQAHSASNGSNGTLN